MATIAENLQTIQTIKNNIKTSIENKGVSVGDVSFTEYSTKIDEITTGGGGGTLETINITENGVYVPSEGVDGYNQVNVNVVPSTNYSYYDGGVDVDGLRAIGWSDESIGMLRDNALHYSWENSEYVVSDENKALYGVINKNNIKTYTDNPNVVFMPMFDINGVATYGSYLENYKYIKGVPILDLSNARNISYFFSNCYNLTTIPQLDTSNVTIMQSMFNNCTSLITIPPIDTSKVTTMNNMFNGCSSLATIPLLDTGKVENMSNMFTGCSKLTTIPIIDTSKVPTMQSMFAGCSKLTTIPQLDTHNVTNMSYMFNSCSSLTTIPAIDTSNVANMSNMFYGCSKLTTIPQLDTSNVTNMAQMFYNCSSLTTISPIDTSKVTTMNYMFNYCSKLVSLPLLDFSSVTSIGTFFGYSNITTLTDLGGFKNLKINWTDTGSLYALPNLTYQSVMNVINNLYDFRSNGDTSTTRTIRFNAKSKALLSDEDIAIATNKGWVIS